MEKVIEIQSLTFQPTKTGKDKWIIATFNGNYSIWDGKLAEKLNKKKGEKVSVEIRPAQEGSNYLPTITDMNDASDGTILKEVQNGVRSLNGQEQDMPVTKEIRENIRRSNLPEPTDRDTRIIAQCLVKAVIGQPCGSNETFDIKAAVDMYHKALELLG